ncbi:hypothetical protein GCM10018793_26170 [Streptomyces sulfonofaciens]|uniref:Acyl-CoA carboxylase subunit epsilon n=1 Tax=Streptomyces sulfonofaciens TaxID=68272 RepID=A0A919G4X8_9ACTN|nr:hypothetical protein GCM10018793_26170 [Streptomyces sulfonofaciens]
MIKVVRGNPTPEELAAAVAVVRARAAALAQGPASPWPGGQGAQGGAAAPPAWSDPARVARTRLPAPGPRSWGRTFWPV